MRMLFLNICLGVSSLFATTLAYFPWQKKIPNGNNVPHPCKTNQLWLGVGHNNSNGGGPLNIFGQHFREAGFEWTTNLCSMDSDGDGRTNGEELGDPSCIWKIGLIPTRTMNISHPGICDPYNSELCKPKNTFVTCGPEGFKTCKANMGTDVRSIDIKFLETIIPSTETNYYCMTFDLPTDQEYHIIANEPIIDNVNAVHHMLLYGCDHPNATSLISPTTCHMKRWNSCHSIMNGWTTGQPGNCYGEKIGFRIGRNGFQRILLEIHYNNPERVENSKDASGFRLYYQTAKEGMQDLFTITVGQKLLEIPPGKSAVEQVGICPSFCTNRLINKRVKVTSVLNHMHLLGRSMKVELFRNGVKLLDLSNDEDFQYDSPVTHNHNPAIEILPGDEIKTTCVYNTLESKRYTYFGESTSDEMCIGIITMYPKEAVIINRPHCLSMLSTTYCDGWSEQLIGQCNFAEFIKFAKNRDNDVMKNCNLDAFCRPECREVLTTLKNHPCLEGQAFTFVTQMMQLSKDGFEFLARLRSCPAENVIECHKCPDQCGNSASNKIVSITFVSILLSSILSMFL